MYFLLSSTTLFMSKKHAPMMIFKNRICSVVTSCSVYIIIIKGLKTTMQGYVLVIQPGAWLLSDMAALLDDALD